MATSHLIAERPVCPVCRGPMWDNRRSKRNPKAPDCKCRDRACTGVIWHHDGPQDGPPQGGIGARGRRGGPPEPIGPVVARVLASIGNTAASLAEPTTNPETTPLDREAASGMSAGGHPDGPDDAGAATRALYRRTVAYVGRHVAPLCDRFGVTISSETFAAMVATLFIALHADRERTPMGPPGHFRGGRRHG